MIEEVVDNVKITCNFVSGAFVKLESSVNKDYLVKFTDGVTGEIYYETTLDGNSWCKCDVKYFVKWNVTIYCQDKLFWQHDYNASGKKVIIEIDTKALGDIIGWFPYVEEFRQQHGCDMYAALWSDKLFTNEYYPHITFIKPKLVDIEFYKSVYAYYSIAVWLDRKNKTFHRDCHRYTFVGIPHQQIASDQLGLKFKEIRPLINETSAKPTNQVCIAIYGSSGIKQWMNPSGWQEVVDWLIDRGYVVKLLGAESDGYKGVYYPKGVIKVDSSTDIHMASKELKQSKLFIGLGSGLTWLAWSLGVPVVVISGFSEPLTEMQSNCIRISAPPMVCSGCYTKQIFFQDRWDYCPQHQDTARQHECSKKITSNMVIEELEKLL